MRVREAGSLALGVAFALTLGVVSSPAAAQLDEARRLYDEAEFEPALTALDRAAEGEGLALADAVALLELRAELHLALEDAAAIDRDFVQLVTIAPDHVLAPHHPPELQEALARARASAGRPLAIQFSMTPGEGRLAIAASASGDPGGVVRELRIDHRQDGGAWETGPAPVEIVGGTSVDVVVTAIGPGGAIVATEGTREAPRSFDVPAAAQQPADAQQPSSDPWPWVGVGIGVGVAAIIAVIVAIVLTTSGESDRTQVGLPTITALTVRF